MSANWINKLNESDSRLHKEDVIKQALEAAVLGSANAKNFLTGAKLCYNPYITYGVKQIIKTSGITNAENPWNDFFNLLDSLSQRELTGHAARDAIQLLSEKFDSEEWNTFCRPILCKDLRAGVSDKTINKICKNTEYEIPIFTCQLAANCEGRPEMKGMKRLEPKLDGVRVIMYVTGVAQTLGESNPRYDVVCYSRNGKVFSNFTLVEEQIMNNVVKLIGTNKTLLANGFVLDGEMIGNSFQELMRQARRKENIQADDSVFSIFDIVPLNEFVRGKWSMPLNKRIDVLTKMRPIIDTMPNVELLPYINVDLDTGEGKDQLHRYAKDMVDAGFEGIMIKDITSKYECKRNTNWMKYKPVYDYDLTVIGVVEGTGKHEGKMGALICEGVDDGKHIIVNVGSGYTDEERQDYWDNQDVVVGQVAVVLADAITQNQNGTYSLRFPRFKCFRTDK